MPGSITAESTTASKQSFIRAVKDIVYFSVAVALFTRRISRDRVVLYAHTPMGGFAGAMVKVFTRLPLVYDPHDWFYDKWALYHRNLSSLKKSSVIVFYKTMAYLLQRIPDVFISVSEAMMDATKAARCNILIPNVLDEPPLFSRTMCNENRYTVVFVGHVAVYQGIANLIKAFRIVEGKLKNAKLLIVGDGEDLQSARELVKRLRLRNVIFTGSVSHEDAYAYIEKAAVCTAPFLPLPFVSTSCPIKLLEYAERGKKIVVTDIPAFRKSLAGYSGAFFASTTLDSLAESMIRALREGQYCDTNNKWIDLRKQQEHVQRLIYNLLNSL